MIDLAVQKLLSYILPKVYAIDGQNPEPPNIPDLLNQFIPIINSLLFVLGPILLVVMIVYAGIRRMMAVDNPKAVQESTQTIFWGVIGYAVVLLSYIIVRLSVSVIGYDINDGNNFSL